MKPIRTVIFGTGFMGRVHLEALRRVEFVEAAAVAGRTAEAAQRLAAGFRVPTIATDYHVFSARPTKILNAALESHRMRGWIDVPTLAAGT
jgi:predicted dehydrogenase